MRSSASSVSSRGMSLDKGALFDGRQVLPLGGEGWSPMV